MAEENIAFSVDVNASGGAKSLADLKKEFKSLQQELSNTKTGTADYQRTLEKLGATKDEIGDLRDTINALNPEGKVAAFAKVGSTIASGFAAAQGAAALFGAESEELQKTMLKVQAAMALAEGIKGITAAGDAFAVLNTVMKANPILAIVAGFTALTAVVATLYNNYKDANSVSAELESNHQKLKASTEKLTSSIDIQIQSLKGLKSNDEEILALTEKKLKANILLEQSSLRVALAKQAEQEAEFNYNEQVLRLAGKNAEADTLRAIRTKEARDATNTAIESLKASIAGLSEFHNTQEQKKLDATADANKKSIDELNKSLKEKEALQKKHIDEILAYQKAAQDEIDKYIKDSNIEARKRLETKAEENKAFDDAELNASFTQVAAISGNKKKAEEQDRAEKQKTMETNLDTTKKGLQAAQAITDLVFAHQLRQAKGNAEKEKEIRKKQFNVNKAFGIANAVVDGVGAVQKALNNPYPLNLVLAVISGVLAAANVVKIASTKFDDGGSGGGAADIGGSIGGAAAAPVVAAPNNTVTKINDDGSVASDKRVQQPAIVIENKIVETDITSKQSNVARIEETAKFG